MEQDAELGVQRGRDREVGLRLVNSLVVREHHETIIMWRRAGCSAGKSINDREVGWNTHVLYCKVSGEYYLHAAPSMFDKAEAKPKVIG